MFYRPQNAAEISRPRPVAQEEDGFVLLAVLFMLFLVVLSLSLAVPSIVTELRREKEAETIHRGMQYARAIRVYYKKYGRYPNTIDQLVNTDGQRFLRRRYLDPLTGKDDWRLIHFGEAQTMTNTIPGSSPVGANGTMGSSGTAVGGAASSGFGSSGSGFGSSGSAFGSSGSSAFGSPSSSGFGSSNNSSGFGSSGSSAFGSSSSSGFGSSGSSGSAGSSGISFANSGSTSSTGSALRYWHRLRQHRNYWRKRLWKPWSDFRRGTHRGGWCSPRQDLYQNLEEADSLQPVGVYLRSQPGSWRNNGANRCRRVAGFRFEQQHQWRYEWDGRLLKRLRWQWQFQFRIRWKFRRKLRLRREFGRNRRD